jgi:hypothetical protein
MVLKVELVDGSGTGNKASTTSRGELVVNKFDYSQAYTVEASVINTAYNFIGPVAGQRFVVTDFFVYANKAVGAADATVELYEASSDDTVTVDKSIFKTEMLKQTRADLTGLNLIISEGKWLNIKTDDNTIFATVMGYYVPE